MKHLIFMTALFLLAACGSNKEEPSQTAAASTNTATNASAKIDYPLPTLYSPTWEAGDQKNAIAILNIGKQWMANDFSAFDKSFADSLSVYLANGDKLIGPRDSILAAMKTFRNMYSEVKSEIHSVIPLRHGETKEDWVCIWFKEIATTTKGVKDSSEYQESWRLSKDGKAELVYQYAATIKPAANKK